MVLASIRRAATSQRAEAAAMVGVACVGLGSLISSAQSESVLSDPASEAAYSYKFPVAFPSVANAIRNGHVIVLDTMLSDRELHAAREDVDILLQQGGGTFAANANRDSSVRRDSVVWITGQEKGVGPGLKHAVALLRGLAHEFAATPAYDKSVLWVQSAAQLACYAGDSQAHYTPHLDASTDSIWTLGLSAWLRARAYRERTITAILYLNDKNWDKDTMGGCLRCHLPNSSSKTGCDSGGVAVASDGGGSALGRMRTKQQPMLQDGDAIDTTATNDVTVPAMPSVLFSGDTTATGGAGSAFDKNETHARSPDSDAPAAAVGASITATIHAASADGAANANAYTVAADLPPAAALAVIGIDNASAAMATTEHDVAPYGGRLVLFDSAAILHEVLPSHNEGEPRIALTVWISDRRER
ncbi:hypothetical protein VYU27_008689 [Nannochloropsis oceanica]